MSTSPPRTTLADDDGRGLVRLVLGLARLLHELLAREAIRQMEQGLLCAGELARVDHALRVQDETIRALCAELGVAPDSLDGALSAWSAGA